MEDKHNTLVIEFQQWRQGKAKGSKTPDHLRKKLAQLIPHFPKSVLARQLNVSYDLINHVNQVPNQQETEGANRILLKRFQE